MARCGLVVWFARRLAEIAGLAAQDARISGFHAHGSASGTAASADSWSDLDVLITAAEPVTLAEDFARRIGSVLSPVFAASRGGDAFGYCVRLVLRDLRMIDVMASAPAGGHQDPACAAPAPDPADAVAGLVNDFRFDAVLAAEPACGDILIGAHLTLQLARQTHGEVAGAASAEGPNVKVARSAPVEVRPAGR